MAIDSVKVNNITCLDDSYFPEFYSELATYQTSGRYACYKVDISATTHEDNEYFNAGISSHVCVVVEDGGQWFVGAIYPYQESSVRGIGYGLINFCSQPTTITVMDDLNMIHKNISFTEVVVNATCNEIGQLNYPREAVYANVMAVKMLCWWAKAGKYREALGCDIKFGDVAYRSKLRTNTQETQVIRNAVQYLKAFYMVSSSSTGRKLFYANYDGYPSQGTHCGTLSQPKSKELANNGNTWKQILHYFYDYSSPNCNTNIGVIEFGHECKLSVGSTYYSNQIRHWNICTICNAKVNEHSHSWVSQSGSLICSVCGKRSSYQISTIIDCEK